MPTFNLQLGPEPIVSVVIATYRASGHLSEAIKSALSQTLRHLEVIVSDDGNNADVAELVASFNDSRLVYLANERRLGPAGNHSRGFRSARGRFVVVLNHDDLLRPTFAEKLSVALMSHHDVVVAFCDHDVIDSTGQLLVEETEAMSRNCGRTTLSAGRHRDTASLVTRGSVPSAVGAMFLRSYLPDLEAYGTGGAYDLYLSLRYVETGLAFFFVKERLTAWRRHASQLTARPDLSWARGSLACWELMRDSPAFRGERWPIRCGVGQSRYRVARLALADGDYPTARVMALMAARSLPWNWRAWALLAFAICREHLRFGQARPMRPL